MERRYLYMSRGLLAVDNFRPLEAHALNYAANREHMTQTTLETFTVPATHVATQTVLSL